MTMEHPPFEDVFPIEHGDFPMSCLVFRGVKFLNYLDVLQLLQLSILKLLLLTSLTGICTEGLRFSIALVTNSLQKRGLDDPSIPFPEIVRTWSLFSWKS